MFIIKEGKPSNNGLFHGLIVNGHKDLVGLCGSESRSERMGIFFINGLVIYFILPKYKITYLREYHYSIIGAIIINELNKKISDIYNI